MAVSRLAVVTRKKVRGEVLYNDGDFAEIQTIGIEGVEHQLLLDTVQIHRRGDTEDTPAEFQQTLKIGTQLYISTTVEIAVIDSTCSIN